MNELVFDMSRAWSRHVITVYDYDALIDTGADITVCTLPKAAIQKKFNILGQTDRTVDSASGEMAGTIYIVEEFIVGDLVMQGVPIFSPNNKTTLKTKFTLGKDLFDGLIYEFNTIDYKFTIKIPDDNLTRKYSKLT